jgi:glycosyltransferase involved in cell wall biosynthesis
MSNASINTAPAAVVINGRFAGKRMTGTQRYAHEIARRLPAAGIAADGADGRVPMIAPSAERCREGLAGHLWEQAVLPARVGSRRVLWSPTNTGPLLVRRQVVTIHDAAFADHPECFSRQFAAWYNWLVPRLARSAARVITISKYGRDRLAEVCNLPAERIDVIPNGVDPLFRPQPADRVDAARARHGLTGDYVLGVGSLDPRKNLAGLLVAWRQVYAEHPHLTLALAGGANARTFAGTGLGTPGGALPPGVKLLGYVDEVDLPPLYAGATSFVFPSLYEGFGLPPLEAMACGTPVVCGLATSLAEVVGDAAEAVESKEPDSIAAGLLRVLGDASRREDLRARGIARAARYTWDRSAAATARVLLEAASERAPAVMVGVTTHAGQPDRHPNLLARTLLPKRKRKASETRGGQRTSQRLRRPSLRASCPP